MPKRLGDCVRNRRQIERAPAKFTLELSDRLRVCDNISAQARRRDCLVGVECDCNLDCAELRCDPVPEAHRRFHKWRMEPIRVGKSATAMLRLRDFSCAQLAASSLTERT